MLDKNILKNREIIIDTIRLFFKKNGFLEVETPLLVSAPDTAPYNEVFETQFTQKKRAFLTPSPEFFMKKLLAQGSGNIFQICKAFRNPLELDPLHNPEFTILEWYRAGASYTDLMIDCENLINYIFKYFTSKTQNAKRKTQSQNSKLKTFLTYRNQLINISKPWIKMSIKEVFKKYANINLDEFLDFKKAKKICQKRGYRVEKKTTWEQLFHQVFLNEIEPKFPQDKPLILYDYPAPLAALAKLKDKDNRYAERFEFYLGGLELGNGYSELTDWQQQEKRLKNDLQERKRLGMKVFTYDHQFIEALKTLPKTAGIAVGVDRLVMLFTNTKTIQEVLPFSIGKIFPS